NAEQPPDALAGPDQGHRRSPGASGGIDKTSDAQPRRDSRDGCRAGPPQGFGETGGARSVENRGDNQGTEGSEGVAQSQDAVTGRQPVDERDDGWSGAGEHAASAGPGIRRQGGPSHQAGRDYFPQPEQGPVDRCRAEPSQEASEPGATGPLRNAGDGQGAG